MKKLMLSFVFLFTFVIFALPVSAESVEYGSISSSVMSYLEGVVEKLPAGTEYFMFKSGDYTVDLITGYDLTYDDNIVSGTGELTRYQYNTRQVISGYDYEPSFTEMQISSFQCDTDQFSICYSSLGPWPALGDQGTSILTYILYSLLFFGFLFLILKFVRNRRHYINL